MIESPYRKANILSKLFLTWLNPLFKAARRGPLNSKEIYIRPTSEAAARVTDDLEKEWIKELSKRKPSIWLAAIRCFWFHIFLAGVFLLVDITTCTLRPILLQQVLLDIESMKVNNVVYKAFVSGLNLALCITFGAISYNTSFWITNRIGMRLRVAVAGLIFKKMLAFSQKSLAETTSGDIITLLTADIQRFDVAFGLLNYFWLAPIQFAVIFWLMSRIALIPSICALIVTLLNIPLGFISNKMYSKLRLSVARATVSRIRLLSDIIKGMRTIKFQTWEDAFFKLVGNFRRKETQLLLKSRFCQLFRFTQVMCQIKTSMTIFILAMVLLNTDSDYLITLKSSYVYTVLNFLGSLFISVTLLLPICLQNTFEVNVTCKRVTDFLFLPELGADIPPEVIESVEPFVQFSNVCAKWKDSASAYNLHQVNYEVFGPQLVAVVGTVGSGKSSFLQAVLGELSITSGLIRRSSDIAYLPGTAWILPGSIRDNILCGLPYEAERYETVLRVTALDVDMTQLPRGDNTHVDERGVNLSGGQKARIGLARIAYSRVPFVLLDDPLSAVDVHVANHIFEECINGFMSNRLRLLATHQVHFLPKVGSIVFLKEGTIYGSGNYSELCEKGLDFHNLHSSAKAEDIKANTMDISESINNNSTPPLITNQKSKEDEHSNTLMKFDSNNNERKTDSKIPLNEESLNRNHLIASSDSASQQRGKEVSCTESETKGNNSNNRTNSEYDHLNEEKARLLDSEKSKVTKGEEKATSENRVVGWRHYCMLARLGGGFCGTFCVAFLFILAVCVYVAWDIWLARWCRQMDNFALNDSENYQRNVSVYSLGSFDLRSKRFNFTVLSCLVIALILVSYTRAMAFFAFMVTAARRLHDKMLHSCLHTPIKFFEMNPSGAIVNRFSKDLTTVDDMLPIAMCDAIQCFLLVLIMGIVIIYMSYWFIIPTIMAIILFYLTQKKYLLISRDLKRLESAAKAPIISWVNVTLQGLPCIRATLRQNDHLVKFQEVMDYHTSVFYLTIAASRWLALRLDLLCVFFTVTIIITCLLLSIYTDFPPSAIGLMITYGINFLGLFQWFIRQSAEVQNQMVSVERIVEYIDLPPELNYTSNQVTLPDNWPQSGQIKFQNFSISYDGEQTWALKNINFVVESGFKVGIVGRTGSGKSTLFSCILRLVTGEQGKILIDDVDIKKVKLEELRKHISVIPQDPMMFAGSIRMNLDPRGEHSDTRIWNALSSVQLEKTISSMDKGLDTLMDEGGSNFSTGERQLLSLARAILDDNRIVLVDEVTANVDSRTDSLIQETLRKQFSTCTVLTITHRLQTIIENDVIVVLENGEIIETGAPHILLHTKQGEGDITDIESMDDEDLPIIGTGPFAKLVRGTGQEESRKLSKMARDAYLKYTQVV